MAQRYNDSSSITDDDVKRFKRGGQIAGLILLGVFLVFELFHSIQSIPVGYRGVRTQFGAIHSVEGEGLHFVWPWPFQQLYTFNVRMQTADIKDADAVTNETQVVKTHLVVRYNNDPAKVALIFEKFSHTGDLSDQLDSATHEVFKAIVAQHTATELVKERQKVSLEIKLALIDKVAMYGAQIMNIDMKDFKFSDTYMAAVDAKVEQEQKRQAAENKTLTVKAEQQQNVAVAEANAQIARAKASGEADALKTQADAERYSVEQAAKAQAFTITEQQKAMAGNPQAIIELARLKVEQAKADKWDGSLPTWWSSDGRGAGAIPYMSLSPPEKATK